MVLARRSLGYPVVVSAGSTVNVYTVGSAKTAFVRTIAVHHASLGSTTASVSQTVQILYVPSTHVGVGTSGHRIARLNLAPDDTFFFEPHYPLTLDTTGDRIQVFNEGYFYNGLSASPVNVLVMGDKEE
jgi:hypothetical protein